MTPVKPRPVGYDELREIFFWRNPRCIDDPDVWRQLFGIAMETSWASMSIGIEYLERFQLIFGHPPANEELANFDAIFAGFELHPALEASLRLALETWLLNGPRIDHVAHATTPRD